MLGIDGRAARFGWTLFLLALVILTAYAIRRTLMVFAVAVFLAYMLTPLVDLVDRYMPRRIPRTVALAIVYLLLIGALVGVGISIGSQIGDEAEALAKQLPGQAQSTVATPSKFPLPAWLEPLRGRITGWIQHQYASGGKDLLPYLETAGLHLFSGAKYALDVVLVPILAFFFLKDGPAIRDSFVEGLTEPSKRKILDD